ncbi:MAG: ZIP family metal transporter [Eubacteriales bacterium]|nr:ZIP family metal transporter [Eubacteriales bacterium]MDD3072901.1 ZIP family metal transporter [Eubacteriales bacterium]MDD4079363.1 ZIP family metal transporter [Eubacteriales bacterium]MDD4769292.1 ZIP family metal transporter [Eubacteriales bacterium]
MGEILVISTLAGLTTALGAGIVILLGKPSTMLLSLLLGFAGGVMLAIANLELLPEAIEIGGTFMALLGFFLGTLMMHLLDHLIPHLHFSNGCEKSKVEMLKVGYLIFLGIAVHNVAEGLAIGAGMVANPSLGFAIAIAIGIHNIPEGMATAVPLCLGGAKAVKVLILTAVAGLMTVVGAVLGSLAFQSSPGFVAAALGFAAGAMFYIVGDELIPHARNYHHYWATIGLVSGFIVGVLL